MELTATASVMGESRRIVGEYELNFDDYMARRQFPDQIGVFNKFVDIHPYDCFREEYDRTVREAFGGDRLNPGECFGTLQYSGSQGIRESPGGGTLQFQRCEGSLLESGDALRRHDGTGRRYRPARLRSQHEATDGNASGSRGLPSPEGTQRKNDPELSKGKAP
jgi:hypothetical protein